MAHCLKLLLCFSLLMTGCRKPKDGDFKSYIRMAIDGVAIECDSQIRASGNHARGTNMTSQVLSISGYWSGNDTKASVEMELYEFKNTAGEFQLIAPSTGYLYYETQKPNGSLVGETYLASGNETMLIIEQVDDRYIKGTFAFVAYINTGPGASVKKTVTNGAFHIKRNP